jgi:hypothetical protein
MKNHPAIRFPLRVQLIACLCLLAMISASTLAANFVMDFSRTAIATANAADDSNRASDPYDFSPEGEDFTVLFPESPRLTVGKRFFGDRQRDHKFHRYTVFSAHVLFVVESYEGDKPKDLMRIAMSGRRGLRIGAAIELNGYKGNEFTQEVEGISFKGKYFTTKKHFYIVEAGKRETSSPMMDEFLDSFSLEQHLAKAPAGAPLGLTDDPAEKVFSARDVSTKAIILSKLPATYTDPARDRMIGGKVVLEAVLRATGDVGDIYIRSELPGGLTEQSIAATKAIIFLPALKDGKAVSQRVLLEYNFNIY